MKTHLKVEINALCVISVTHNLVMSFILREEGITVNYVPRIHCGEDVTHNIHSLIFE